MVNHESMVPNNICTLSQIENYLASVNGVANPNALYLIKTGDNDVTFVQYSDKCTWRAANPNYLSDGAEDLAVASRAVCKRPAHAPSWCGIPMTRPCLPVRAAISPPSTPKSISVPVRLGHGSGRTCSAWRTLHSRRQRQLVQVTWHTIPPFSVSPTIRCGRIMLLFRPTRTTRPGLF